MSLKNTQMAFLAILKNVYNETVTDRAILRSDSNLTFKSTAESFIEISELGRKSKTFSSV